MKQLSEFGMLVVLLFQRQKFGNGIFHNFGGKIELQGMYRASKPAY